MLGLQEGVKPAAKSAIRRQLPAPSLSSPVLKKKKGGKKRDKNKKKNKEKCKSGLPMAHSHMGKGQFVPGQGRTWLLASAGDAPSPGLASAARSGQASGWEAAGGAEGKG